MFSRIKSYLSKPDPAPAGVKVELGENEFGLFFGSEAGLKVFMPEGYNHNEPLPVVFAAVTAAMLRINAEPEYAVELIQWVKMRQAAQAAAVAGGVPDAAPQP